MYKIIKDVLENGKFELNDILHKINKMWIESAITEEEKTELDNLARENAKAENSYAPLQEQIDKLYTYQKDLESRVSLLEQEGQEEPTEPEPVEEYPEYVKPTNSTDCYNTGDKITFNGKKYVCKIDGCVWDPTTYPPAWQEVTDSTENSAEENESED